MLGNMHKIKKQKPFESPFGKGGLGDFKNQKENFNK